MNSLEQDKVKYLNGSAIACEQGDVWISLLNLLIAKVCKEVGATTGLSRWWLSAMIECRRLEQLSCLLTN